MKKECEICGFGDNSFKIEDNGIVLKVCKFCRDGFNERKREEAAANGETYVEKTVKKRKPHRPSTQQHAPVLESKAADVEPFENEEEAKKVILERVGSIDDDEDNSPLSKMFAVDSAESKSVEQAQASSAQVVEIIDSVKLNDKTPKGVKLRYETNPHIDDERISVTSPEVVLQRDERPKTNLDVAVLEFEHAVNFQDAFKLIYNKILFTVLLVLVSLAVCTVLAVNTTWKIAATAAVASGAAIAVCFVLMWFLQSRYGAVRRTLLLRIRQQEILFDTYHSDCYRELKTKYTMIKAISWLTFRLSVILPILVIVGTIVTGVVLTFNYNYHAYAISLAAGMAAGIVVFWVFKLINDCVNMYLDVEKNQQMQQQTLLDILSELKKINN